MDSAFASSFMLLGHAFFDFSGVPAMSYVPTACDTMRQLVLATLLGAVFGLGLGRHYPDHVTSHALAALAASTYSVLLIQVGYEAMHLLSFSLDMATWVMPFLFLVTATSSEKTALRPTSIVRFGTSIVVGGVTGAGFPIVAISVASVSLLLLGLLLRIETPRD